MYERGWPAMEGGEVSLQGRMALVTVAVLAGAIGGVGATMAIEAGASGSNTAYYACLSTKGALSKVGTTSPICPSSSTVINWNQTGPQGRPETPGHRGRVGRRVATSHLRRPWPTGRDVGYRTQTIRGPRPPGMLLGS